MSKQRISTRYSLLLIIGFVSITAAITGAYLTPATSYELSIYRQTPTIFWIGVLIAIVLSVIITFASKNSLIRTIGLNLGAFSIISVILLPVIRSYYYIGEADSLSHLGNALDIKAGAVSVFDQLYPLSHTLSVFIYHITGIEIRRALMLLLAVFAVVFILFVTLTTRLFSNDKWMISVSVFSSLLLLPVNHFTGHMHPHTTSYAMHFVPFSVYLFALLIYTSDKKHVITSTIGLSGLILLHPQQAANVIILFSTVAVVQLAVELSSRKQRVLPSNRQIYPYMIIMTTIFWLWTEGLEKVSGNIQKPLMNFLGRHERIAGGNVRSAVPSLEAAGGSPEEVFIKLFSVGFIYCIFSAVIMSASLTELFKSRSSKLYKYGKRLSFSSSSSNLFIIYLTVGFVAIIGLFFVYILADQSAQYFRHHSFMMAIVTILGSLSLAQLLKMANRNMPERSLTTGVCILFIIFLLFSIPIIHISPYLYQESEHVPETQIKGYETIFEHHEEGTPFTVIRSNSYRYNDAINGERRDISYRGVGEVPYHFSEEGNLRSYYEEETYLVVTNRDRTRDRYLHQGVRYTQEDYEHFDEGRGINRIQDNGGFTLYRIIPPAE